MQDIGFYDTNRTGEITSRLAADTTTVADQVSRAPPNPSLELTLLASLCILAGLAPAPALSAPVLDSYCVSCGPRQCAYAQETNLHRLHSLVATTALQDDLALCSQAFSTQSPATTICDPQVSLNLNVLVRSLTQASVVLAFMFGSSWRLTVVTFILIPFVMLISKVYGAYYRKLSKKVW